MAKPNNQVQETNSFKDSGTSASQQVNLKYSSQESGNSQLSRKTISKNSQLQNPLGPVTTPGHLPHDNVSVSSENSSNFGASGDREIFQFVLDSKCLFIVVHFGGMMRIREQAFIYPRPLPPPHSPEKERKIVYNS